MSSNHPYEENNLVQRFQAGDIRAFTEIYDRYYFSVYQYSKRWLYNKQEAEDVVSETFIKLLQRCGQMESQEKIAAFLKVTARNACLDILRHNKVKSEKHADLLQSLLLESEPDFAWLEIREEFLRLVYAEVEKMPRKMKEIFLLSYKEGLKPAEIAQRLNLNVQTVSNQKSNAIKLIRIALGQSYILFPLFFPAGFNDIYEMLYK
ncbi:sigma-70 family RNA polymerase sigma factor [Chitinophaga sp. YIM B06452]|uniref:RNA polymerase sigma factor n=1 Tax=Chitinophaga sp. YIM B06452 TaxID=3082158 RepID=UPI0031FE7991